MKAYELKGKTIKKVDGLAGNVFIYFTDGTEVQIYSIRGDMPSDDYIVIGDDHAKRQGMFYDRLERGN